MNLPTTARTDPAGVADLLAAVAGAHAADTEIAAILTAAAAALKALGWNRYAATVQARSERSALKRRHQARAGGVARA